jgi:hypothetical protein
VEYNFLNSRYIPDSKGIIFWAGRGATGNKTSKLDWKRNKWMWHEILNSQFSHYAL